VVIEPCSKATGPRFFSQNPGESTKISELPTLFERESRIEKIRD
jgi:hypothetical protein